MPAKQITLGKSFQKILKAKEDKLLADRRELQELAKQRFRRMQRDLKDVKGVLGQYESEVGRMQRLITAFDSYYEPVARQAFEEKWDDATLKAKAEEAARKIRAEVPTELDAKDIIQFVKQQRKKGRYKTPTPSTRYAIVREGKTLENIEKPASEVLEEFRGRAVTLRDAMAELGKERALLRGKYAAGLRTFRGELEKVGEAAKSLGTLEYSAAERARKTPLSREERLVAFAMSHLGSKPMVEQRIKSIQGELVSIASLAEQHKRALDEANNYRKSVKKLEEKQLQPLLVFLQKHHALRKEDRRYVTKEYLKDALRSLKGKVPDAQLKQHAALMPLVAKYEQYQRNARMLDNIADNTAVHSERMRELNGELKYMEKVRKLIAAAESVRKG